MRTVAQNALHAAILLAAVVNCSRPSKVTPAVGVIVATEGPADYIGRPERDVLEALSREYVDAPSSRLPFELKIYNSAGDPTRAGSIFRDLAADSNVIAVVGPSTSGEAIVVAQLADELKVPVLALAASKKIVLDTADRVREWVFKFAQNDDLAAQALLTALAVDKKTRVAFLYSNDGFGKSGAEQFKQAASALGAVRLDYVAAYDPKLTTGDPTVRAAPANVDAFVVWGTAPGPAEIVHALRRKGISSIYLSHGSASSEFIESLGADAEGIVILGSRVLLEESALDSNLPADKVILDYQRFWGKHFRGTPSHFGGHARDAFEALLQVFSGKTSPSRVAVRDGLESLKSLNGVTGTFRFSKSDHAGLDASAFATFRIRGGRFVPQVQPTR